jgi:hypothetical protein
LQDKLDRRAYPNLAAVESDIKRMILNAKDYYKKDTAGFNDAERVRKTASNFMVRYNPAYKTVPNYAAVPTPIPGEAVNGGHTPAKNNANTPSSTRPITLRINASSHDSPAPRRAAAHKPAPEPEPEEDEEDEEEDEDVDAEGEEDLADFTGKSFQEAQDQIMEELISYEE